MQCPRCGYVLGPFERMCPKCARLGGAPPASSAPADQPSTKLCQGCGAQAVLSQAACARCGQHFAPVISQPWASGVEGGPHGRAARGASGHGRRLFPAWVLGPIIALCFVLFAVAARLMPLDSGPGRRGAAAPNLLMLDGGAAGRGPGVTGASAVPSDQIGKRLLEARANVGGDLEVSLAWNGYSDLDLSVRDPSDALTDFVHPTTASGELDVDANAAGIATVGSGLVDPQEARRAAREEAEMSRALDALGAVGGGPIGGARRIYTEKPVEHVYYVHAAPGVYTAYVRCFNWREATRDPLPFTVQIKSRGVVFRQINGTAGPESFVTAGIHPTIVCQFEVR